MAKGIPEEPKRIIPDGCVDLRLDWRNPDRCVLVGPQTTASVLKLDSPYEFVGVRLLPAAAYSLIKIPVDEFKDSRIPLQDVLPGGRELIEQIQASGSISAAMSVLASSLAERMQRLESPNRRAVAAVRSILSTGGKVPIRELSDDMGLSRGHLHQIFAQHIGVSPKHFSRMVRVRAALGMISPEAKWASIAADAGYSDQSHFIRDFLEFVGMTPEQYLADTAPSRHGSAAIQFRMPVNLPNAIIAR
jgi:AraC-like DNA-binding protein